MKSIRLKDFDYSREKYYYITILPYDKHYKFCHIDDREVRLNKIGEIINKKWLWLFDQYDHIIRDEFIIMPDHFHAILKIDHACVEDGRDRPLHCRKLKPLSQIIGAFKTTSSKEIHLAGFKNFKWHRSYYERILRTGELCIKREYIRTNPQRWIENLHKH